jgi:hypothetical protein
VLYLSLIQKGFLFKKFWYGLVFFTGLLQGAMCVGNAGTMEGILSSKGDTWIEVLDDGNYLHRFIPEWIGRGPANGGSFKPETILLLNDLVVGNRISVRWSMDQHLRLVYAQILPPKTQGGIFIGYILKTSNRWIDVQNIDEGKPWRFYLPWKGGYPSEGGGYDLDVLLDLKGRNPTDPVRLSWEYRGRPTVVSLYEKVRDSTVPFWLGKKLPEPKSIRVQVKPSNEGTPEGKEILTPANPFDQVNTPSVPPVGKNPNPFDQLNQAIRPPANPFDQLVTPSVPSADKPSNPFDNLPLPQTSPFELIEKK